jgi:diadenosine tetraphosphate (Ap4A) HIT family hydrolase
VAVIYEARHFVLRTLDQPHVSRADGGHIVIDPKVAVEDRTQLTREQAIELVKLTMVGGEAMKTVLARKGIDIGRINYQDNGNWRAELHVHLYGRARGATLQPWGHALAFPPTREAFRREMGSLEPLHEDDIIELRTEITRLLAGERYRDF